MNHPPPHQIEHLTNRLLALEAATELLYSLLARQQQTLAQEGLDELRKLAQDGPAELRLNLACIAAGWAEALKVERELHEDGLLPAPPWKQP